MNQKKFNEILRSKGYKIISIDYFPNHYSYYIRKLDNEKITSKDYLDFYKIKDAVSFKGNDNYIEFDIKKISFINLE